MQRLVAEKGDISPGRVMLENMWLHYGLAAEAQRGGVTTPESKKLLIEHMKEAHAAAKDAAPYVHTRLAAVHVTAGELDGDDDSDGGRTTIEHNPLELSEAELAKLDDAQLAQLYRETVAASSPDRGDPKPDPTGA